MEPCLAVAVSLVPSFGAATARGPAPVQPARGFDRRVGAAAHAWWSCGAAADCIAWRTLAHRSIGECAREQHYGEGTGGRREGSSRSSGPARGESAHGGCTSQASGTTAFCSPRTARSAQQGYRHRTSFGAPSRALRTCVDVCVEWGGCVVCMCYGADGTRHADGARVGVRLCV
eukprot:5433861-Prymnesium_polylepis.1